MRDLNLNVETWSLKEYTEFKIILTVSHGESAWEESLEVVNDNLSKGLLFIFCCFVWLLGSYQISGTFSLFDAWPELVNIDVDLLKLWEVSSAEDQRSVRFIFEDDVSIASLGSSEGDVLLFVLTEESGVGADDSQIEQIAQSWSELVAEFAWEFDWIESYCIRVQNLSHGVESVGVLLLKSVKIEFDDNWFVLWDLNFWENVFSQNSWFPVFK